MERIVGVVETCAGGALTSERASWMCSGRLLLVPTQEGTRAPWVSAEKHRV